MSVSRPAAPATWLGTSVRNIANEGEMSAFGLSGVTGVLVLEVPANSDLAKAGLRKNDVILSINGEKTVDTAALQRHGSDWPAGTRLKLGVSRDQQEMAVELVQRKVSP